MRCIQVYPIIKKTFSEILTYWTDDKQDLHSGEIILITIRNQKVWAVIHSVLSVHESKEFIRNQSFTIKKLSNIEKNNFLSKEFISAVLKTSTFYMRDFGEVLSEFIPKKILEKFSNDINHKSDIETYHTIPTQNHKKIFKKNKDHILPIDFYLLEI